MLESEDTREPSLALTKRPGDDDYYQPDFREILGFNGTLRADRHNKLAKLHNQITTSETRYNYKRRYLEQVGILSQWFDTAILDQVSLILEKISDRCESNLEEEIKKFLAFIDCFLRLEGNTIRWKTFIEINNYFSLKITKKNLFKYRIEAQKMLFERFGRREVIQKLRNSSVLITKRIANDFITTDNHLSLQEKIIVRKSCFHIISKFKMKQFIPRDHEIYAFAAYYIAKKGIIDDIGKYNFPIDNPKFRRSISNAIYNIKIKVMGDDPVEVVLNKDNETNNNTHISLTTIR
ncbi:MAG: hypothetical protein ACXAEU_26590 [Candidatus Hodarchaeales archaeon]|jgi:hypothetical protein